MPYRDIEDRRKYGREYSRAHIEGRREYNREWARAHYVHKAKVPVEERFWAKVAKSDDCWEWTGARDRLGYTHLSVVGRPVMAHRFAYELLIGPIPEGLTLDHLCRNRACVNPAHLEPVTLRENILRGTSMVALNARKTACKHGHSFTPENTRLRSRGDGRECRACIAVRRNTEPARAAMRVHRRAYEDRQKAIAAESLGKPGRKR